MSGQDQSRMSPNKVQTLFELCKTTFSSSFATPSPLAIQKLRSVLDTFSPADVGLSEDISEQDRGYGFFGQNLQRNRLSNIVARWSQPVTYLHIYECDRFSIGIFCLPTSACIPLHDHPGMTVLSKMLYGSMHVKAYDWVGVPNSQTGSNLSQLLDVLAPPYSENEGRHCTYYRDYPCTPGDLSRKTAKDEDYAWLEIDNPEFFVRRGEYKGPKVML